MVQFALLFVGLAPGQGTVGLLSQLYPFASGPAQVREFEGPRELRRYAISETVLVEPDFQQAQRPLPREKLPPPVPVTYTEQLASMPGRQDFPKVDWSSAKTNGQAFSVDLGFGLGHHWTSFGTLPFALNAKVRLGLTGGESAEQIAVHGLHVHDDNNVTDELTWQLLTSAPFHKVVMEALRKHDPATFDDFLQELGTSRDAKSTKLLIDTYWNGDPKGRQIAAAILSDRPFRPEARAVYVDLAGRGQAWAIDAVAELHATEALPVVRHLWLTTDDFWVGDASFRAMRNLTGKPLPAEAVGAVERLIAGAGSAHDRKLAGEEPDFTAILAIEHMRVFGKGARVRPENKMALEFFRTLSPWTQKRYGARFKQVVGMILAIERATGVSAGHGGYKLGRISSQKLRPPPEASSSGQGSRGGLSRRNE